MEACTSLAEAADRLRSHTATHLRHERIQLLSHDDVSLLNTASLDESVAYIQMTHVQPVHTSDAINENIQLPKQQSTTSLVDMAANTMSLARLTQQHHSQSGYSRSTNVKQFVFET